MAGLAGKTGSVTTTTPAHTYVITGWTIDDSVDLLDDTNSASGGEETLVPGVTSCGGTFTMNYDGAGSFMPDLTPGTALAALDLVVSGSQKYAVAAGYVESRSIALTIRGLVEITVNWRGSGVTLATADAGLTSA